MPDIPSSHRRSIRSFVRRGSKCTAAQSRALQTLWSKYGLDFPPKAQVLDWLLRANEVQRPVVIEVGIGNGEVLVDYAKRFGQTDWLGIDVHRPGLGHTLLKAEEAELDNLVCTEADANEVLLTLPPASLQGLHVFFPDPWHKKRHHKRRLLQVTWLKQAHALLRDGGYLHIATDWLPYAEHVQLILNELPECFDVQVVHDRAWPDALPEQHHRPLSKYEQRGLRLKHKITDFIAYKR